MWDYCVYLGPFTSSTGKNYDLGIAILESQISAAIVHGDEPGNYSSGALTPDMDRFESYAETRRRAIELNLIPK